MSSQQESAKEQFEKMVATYGDPTDVMLAFNPKRNEIGLFKKSAKTLQLVGIKLPAMKTDYVDDTGEGSFMKGLYPATKRPDAKYVLNLKSGTLRADDLDLDPLMLLRQRAAFTYARRLCKNALGACFDFPGKSVFTPVRDTCLAEAKKAAVDGFIEYYKESEDAGDAVPKKGTKEFIKFAEEFVANDDAQQAKILRKARDQFIKRASHPFKSAGGGDDDDDEDEEDGTGTSELKVKFNRKVWGVRSDRVKAWPRGTRPIGPGTDVPFSLEAWPEIHAEMSKEYVWKPFTYVEGATGKIKERSVLKDADGKPILSTIRAQKKDKKTGRMVDDPEGEFLPLENPCESEIDGTKYTSLVEVSGIFSVYCLPKGGQYGISMAPEAKVTVLDRIPREAGSGHADKTGNVLAAKRLARKLDDIVNADDDDNGNGNGNGDAKRHKTDAENQQ